MQVTFFPNRSITKDYTAGRPIPYHYGSVEASGGHVKAVFDFALAVSAILLLLPLLLGIAVAIKVDSYGPLFYRRRVLGRNGRIFYAYRFRTVSVNNRRRTRVGEFLLRTRLVELPLLINILKHEISFVGPRAVTPEQIVMYGIYADRLLSVTPGITGQWQINGRDQEKRIEQDMQYIDKHSLATDIAILFKTVTAVFILRR